MSRASNLAGFTTTIGGSNLNVGVVTATRFVGDGSNITNVAAVGSIAVNDNGSSAGAAATTLNFSTNLNVSTTSVGIVTVTVGDTDFEIADKIVHTGDTNTAIRFPAADTVSVETGGSERLRVDSSGRLLVATTSASGTHKLQVNGSAQIRVGESLILQNAAGSAEGSIECAGAGSNTDIRIRTNSTERLRINHAGNVGIGTDNPNDHNSFSRALDINGPSGAAVYMRTAGSSTNTFIVGNYGSDAYLNNVANGNIRFYTQGDERVRITNAGLVGIGTNNPNQKLHVHSSGTSYARFTDESSGTGASDGVIIGLDHPHTYVWNYEAGDFVVGTNSAERMRIDSSGRLLIGTTSARNTFYGATTIEPQFQIESAGTVDDNRMMSIVSNPGDTGGYAPTILLGRSRSATANGVGALGENDPLGQISFQGADSQKLLEGANISAVCDAAVQTAGEMPGRLVFSTTADGASSPTERMRISSAGANTLFSDNTVIFAKSKTTNYNDYLFYGENNASSTTSGGTVQIQIQNDGDIKNTDNSYGAISDVKLKENIVDASSQWDDIKALRVRNYNFKKETGYNTHKQLGLIAQEIESICPGLVDESPDRGNDGDDLGTVTKSINYSVLYMKAVKALQEAIAKIETLETKVAALEAG